MEEGSANVGVEMAGATGLEPDQPTFSNRLMARDFCYNCLKARRFSPSIESPGVPSSPPESTPVLETFWRRVRASTLPFRRSRTDRLGMGRPTSSVGVMPGGRSELLQMQEMSPKVVILTPYRVGRKAA